MPPRRTITLLEAHPRSSALPDNDSHYRSSDRVTGPSPAPTSTQTAKRSPAATNTNAASPSRTQGRRTSRRGKTPAATTLAFTTTAKSSPDSKAAPLPTVTEYSSTTTIYTSGFATSTRPETSPPSSTIAGPPVHRTRVESYEIPDPPVWFPYMIATLLAIMLALAVLFYFVNFPRTGRAIREMYHQWRRRVAERRNRRYGYEKVQGIELDGNSCRSSGTSPALRNLSEVARSGEDDVVPAAFTTSTNTPGLHNTPTLYSRRRRGEGMSVDTSAAAGLGITFDRGQSSGKSFDPSLLRPDMDKPLPAPPKSPTHQAIQSAKAFLPRTANKPTDDAAPVPRKNSTDLEAGLLKPLPRDRRRPNLVPLTPSTASAPPSPGMRVLEMVGGSVEYAAEKMSRFMHDQVKGNPEEGLLLPVRDCEREREMGEGCSC
ncbi:hypothetical protein M409DRAFT_16680 [Zasmidium cellare ATCC 36951]|uniref:Transmembrane protein n=1 Tax=Zasmidium cellare ATCC 36951 TaxID=1080233 RepID=A0A6A6D2R8_ZASCE|nr:uncharacterized protein M409DRAFT_16680 [Zasmidium cellare ATCC 36951]KAF2172718.1 hypothetical protein M409DRAFT_16680 [Zasmidium cellare ATCC 36951]